MLLSLGGAVHLVENGFLFIENETNDNGPHDVCFDFQHM